MSLSDVFSYSALVHAVAGTCGGQAAMTAFYPLDVIRTHQQVDKNKTLSDILREGDGVKALYRGLGPVLLSLGVSNFIYFYSNNLLKVILKRFLGTQKVAVWQNLVIASIAGVINVLTTCPLWVANTRLKLQNDKRKTEKGKAYKGLLDCMLGIAREEGVGELWGGVWASLVLVSNPTIQFVVYDYVVAIMKQRNASKYLSSVEVFLAGAIAKAAATFLTYPVQIAQSRLRYQPSIKKGETDSKERYRNTIDVLVKLYKADGLLGWYSGLNIKMLQTVLTAAFQFMCYERIASFIFRVMARNAAK